MKIKNILVILTSFALFSMTIADNITQKEITDLYPDLFTISTFEYNGEIHVSASVNIIEKGNLAPVLNDKYKQKIVQYLFVNYTGTATDKFDGYSKDSVELYKEFNKAITKETVFNKYLMQFAHDCYRAKGVGISDYKPMKKVQISLDSMLNLVSRFHYPVVLNDERGFYSKRCVGSHGCSKDASIEMLPIIEAFAFNVVRFSSENVDSDYDKALAKVRALNVAGLTDEEKLLLYRESVYKEMQKSKALKKALIKHYDKMKDVLNFEIID